MGVSCAVYNLSPHGATNIPLLEATKVMKLEAREGLQNLNSEERFLECLRVFEGGVTSEDSFPGLAECFQDLDSMQEREQMDEKAIKFEEEDLSFSLVTEESPWSCSQDPFSMEPAAAAVGKYQQNCEVGKIGFQTSFADNNNNDEKPEGLFDLWEGQERKELMGVCKETSIKQAQGDTLLEWAGDSDTILTFEDRERLWFTFPQLKCQQALPELTRISSTESHYGAAASDPLSQHCPAISNNFDLMYSQGQLDALSRPVGLLQAEPCNDIREQQNLVSHMDSGIGSWQEPAQAIFSATTQSKNDQKTGLPSRAGRKCRMARKRRALPYHVPLPACSTSKKSVEELITEKNLEFLLQKELKPSDVGNLGRIVLPKREAESSLPYLTVREGMTIVMEDLTTAYKWHMRYRFWPNNKSRMYLLENTGEFVRSHCLKEGDLLRLYKYRDSEGGKYVILGKKASSCKDDSASPRSRCNSSAFGDNKKNKSVKSKRDDSVPSMKNKSCKIDANSRLGNDKSVHVQETSSSSGSERDGLANFEAFEASDIQEILTSLG